jgi:mono/diheme cytochrome c family protein
MKGKSMWKRRVSTLFGALIAIAGSGFGYLYWREPSIAPPSDVKVAMTRERVARGKYIFEIAADCDGCHSLRDFSHFGGPVTESGRGQGQVFPPEIGLPGKVTASNITPDKETGIGNWTDGEKIRAIREGISRDGHALFPMMPYANYRHMSDEDVYSLVAYLNSLPPVKNPLPKTDIQFPVSLLIKSVPQPADSVPEPDRSDKIKYGEYLVTIAGCTGCHTPSDKGKPLKGMRLAGGEVFRLAGAVVVSANITPDPETGIGRWSEQDFLDKFYQYREYAEKCSPEIGPESFTLMPWLAFSQRPPEELSAIFAYLKAQPAVYHSVETHPGK